MLEVVEALMGVAAERAAKAVHDDDHATELRLIYERVSDLRRGDAEGSLLEARADFYDAIIRISGNSELARTMPLLQLHLLRVQFHAHVTGKQRKAQLDEYDVIAEHILSGDARKAGTAMRRHLRLTRSRIQHMPAAVFRE